MHGRERRQQFQPYLGDPAGLLRAVLADGRGRRPALDELHVTDRCAQREWEVPRCERIGFRQAQRPAGLPLR
ncbi:hypothetical protein GCM10010191_49940 [Actinomadura vinacea]|uniref:Uncharacterized protein n=1 Tax=Actinomadura vinacea TaxID=115336 RepID=A0ABN3JHG2_9ACTN